LDILHKLAENLLEKETVMGKELDELIHSLRPGIKLPSKTPEDLETTTEPTETAAGQS
jgi:cell division protease FtsH